LSQGADRACELITLRGSGTPSDAHTPRSGSLGTLSVINVSRAWWFKAAFASSDSIAVSRSEQRRGRAILGALVVSALICAGAGDAWADQLGDAKAQAAKIAAQVNQLQPQVDQALADYETALNAVGESVSVSVAARRAYEALQAQATAADVTHDARAVALYESGGTLTLYAAVLQSGDPNNLTQVPLVTGVVARDAALAATARRAAQAAKQRADAADYQISTDLTNADSVDQRLTQLQNLLAEQQALLDTASAKATQLQALRDAAEAVAAARAAAAAANADAASSVTPYPIPAAFRALYQAAAATCPGLSWTVLAAIGQVETHHGSGTMVSSAGALGPMQFLPATFAHYAVDGDHDGKADIMNPADSIYTAAHYLCANGAGTGDNGLYNAVWHYNHADWYVQLVLSLAGKIT
jgi:peptidoglycan hydrolase CwlO-like protein